MPNSPAYRRPLAALVATALLVPCLSTPALAKSDKSIQKTEAALLAAGFVERVADTPTRAAMLIELPKNKFVRRVMGSTVHYVYADPKNCNCLFVGTQQAYGAYTRTMQAQNLANTQELAAQNYANPRWNWGAWGGWDRGWGFGRRGW